MEKIKLQIAETFQDLANIFNNELEKYLSFIFIPIFLSILLTYFKINFFDIFDLEFFFQYKAITNYFLIFAIWGAIANLILLKKKDSSYSIGIVISNIIDIFLDDFVLVLKEITTNIFNGLLRVFIIFAILQLTFIFFVFPIILVLIIFEDSNFEGIGATFAIILMKVIYLYLTPASIYFSLIYWSNKTYLSLGRDRIQLG